MTDRTETHDVTSRKVIRSEDDLRLYIARIALYVAVIATVAAAVHEGQALSWHSAPTLVGVFVAAAVFAVPIAWEFGRMYLELWQATRSLHRLATTDHRTGLLNNHAFVSRASDRIDDGRRIALLVGDLDRFKMINDRHGHPKGDEVIAAVGAAMCGLFGDDMVGRMGGEEFAVILDCPFSDDAAAAGHCERFAEELRRRIAAIRIPAERGTIRPTMSIGVARVREGEDFGQLYARADKALYLAKASGRNRVIDENRFELDEAAPPRLPDDCSNCPLLSGTARC